jgi:hypothetical protein
LLKNCPMAMISVSYASNKYPAQYTYLFATWILDSNLCSCACHIYTKGHKLQNMCLPIPYVINCNYVWHNTWGTLQNHEKQTVVLHMSLVSFLAGWAHLLHRNTYREISLKISI